MFFTSDRFVPPVTGTECWFADLAGTSVHSGQAQIRLAYSFLLQLFSIFFGFRNLGLLTRL